MKNNKYYSKHTFMFPFQWDYRGRCKSNLYSKRTNLKDFCRLFEQENPLFKLMPFKIDDNASKFNEYNYFYSFARKALYYINESSLSRYYELDEPNGTYNIEYLDNTSTVTKTLKLDSICLHIFETGIGIITYNLTNNLYADEKSILEINEFGRRIYPQFMSEENRLSAKDVFLAQRIYGEIGGLTFNEDFTAYEEPIDTESVFLPPDHIKKVFGYSDLEQLGDKGKRFVFTQKHEQKNTIRIRLVTDDRMFFLCYYQNDVLVNSIFPNDHYLENDFWYAYIFGDKNKPSVYNAAFKKEEIKKCTYLRWLGQPHSKQESATAYGFSKDSFVGIGNWDLIGYHMQTIYYQIAILCLLQRASVLRFGWEITQITNQIFKEKNRTDKAIQELYENYIRFINQIYFREITAQIQGVEIYEMFQKIMNIEKETKDLDSEMQELFNYLSVQEQSKLGKVANLFLPVTLLAGILGINTIAFKQTQKEELLDVFSSISYFVTVVLFILTIYVFVKQVYNYSKRK